MEDALGALTLPAWHGLQDDGARLLRTHARRSRPTFQRGTNMDGKAKNNGKFAMSALVTICIVTFCAWVAWHVLNQQSAGFGAVALLILVGLAAFLGIMNLLAVGAYWMGFSNAAQPFGLPEGTVRAILTIAFVVLIAVLAAYLNTAHKERVSFASTPLILMSGLSESAASEQARELRARYGGEGLVTVNRGDGNTFRVELIQRVDHRLVDDIAKQTFTMMATIVAAMIGFYFGTRSGAEGDQAAAGRAKSLAALMAAVSSAPSELDIGEILAIAEQKRTAAGSDAAMLQKIKAQEDVVKETTGFVAAARDIMANMMATGDQIEGARVALAEAVRKLQAAKKVLTELS